MELELVEDVHDDGLKRVEVALEVETERFQGQGEIGRELTGQVEDATTAAIDPVDPNPPGAERWVIGGNVGPAPRAANADRRRVLAEDQGRPAALAEVVDKAPLKAWTSSKSTRPRR